MQPTRLLSPKTHREHLLDCVCVCVCGYVCVCVCVCVTMRPFYHRHLCIIPISSIFPPPSTLFPFPPLLSLSFPFLPLSSYLTSLYPFSLPYFVSYLLPLSSLLPLVSHHPPSPSLPMYVLYVPSRCSHWVSSSAWHSLECCITARISLWQCLTRRQAL